MKVLLMRHSIDQEWPSNQATSCDFGEWHVEQILIPRGAVRNDMFMLISHTAVTWVTCAVFIVENGCQMSRYYFHL